MRRRRIIVGCCRISSNVHPNLAGWSPPTRHASGAAGTGVGAGEKHGGEWSMEHRKKILTGTLGSMEAAYPSLDSGSGLESGVALANFQREWGGDRLKAGEHAESAPLVRLCGRIMQRREAARGLVFMDLRQNGGSIQVMASAKRYGAGAEVFHRDVSLIRRGDVVEMEVYPARSKTGELSAVPKHMRLLSPCVEHLPEDLRNPDDRVQRRWVDLQLHEDSRGRFLARSRILRALREQLHARDFVEVETPTLSPVAGGASATPFSTIAQATKKPLYLRVSPELYLKRLVVGGFERVFEIGKSFRNEGQDATHNFEFTMCEFYMAFATYEDLMPMTEALLASLAQAALGLGVTSTKVELPGGASSVEVDFAGPYRRISIADYLVKEFGEAFRSVADWEEPGIRRLLLEGCRRLGVRVEDEQAPMPKLLDAVVSHGIEQEAVQPTFVLDHPLCMSPLAKQHPGRLGYSARFELFVARKELANAYSELNDPDEQRRRFQYQAYLRAGGDPEAQIPDEPFCKALDYGLPPTAGWGLGIDRLVMLLSGTHHIRDVQFFLS